MFKQEALRFLQKWETQSSIKFLPQPRRGPSLEEAGAATQPPAELPQGFRRSLEATLSWEGWPGPASQGLGLQRLHGGGGGGPLAKSKEEQV